MSYAIQWYFELNVGGLGSALKGLGQPTPPPGPGGANRAISDRQILVEKVL